MKPEDQNEYSAAFNAEDPEAMPQEAMPAEEGAKAPPVDAEAVAELMADETANAVPDSEGEGPGMSEPASAMTDMAEDPAVDEPMAPEDEQRAKSWEGRLKKREEELAAREAALREQEMGDKAEGMDNWEDLGEAPEMAEGDEDSGAMFEAIKQEAAALAQDPAMLARTIKQMVDDFGRDFVVSAAALAAPVVDMRATPYVDAIEGKMTSMIDDITQALQSMHRSAIADAHEDFEEVAQNPEFKAWIEAMPDDKKEKAVMIVDRGSAGQIVKLLTEFKSSLNAPEKSPEDVWAEDAAAGVKGSAPLKLPTRAAASPEDEYRRAWDEA